MQVLQFRVEGLDFVILGLGFKVEGRVFKAEGLKFLRCEILQGFGFGMPRVSSKPDGRRLPTRAGCTAQQGRAKFRVFTFLDFGS